MPSLPWCLLLLDGASPLWDQMPRGERLQAGAPTCGLCAIPSVRPYPSVSWLSAACAFSLLALGRRGRVCLTTAWSGGRRTGARGHVWLFSASAADLWTGLSCHSPPWRLVPVSISGTRSNQRHSNVSRDCQAPGSVCTKCTSLFLSNGRNAPSESVCAQGTMTRLFSCADCRRSGAAGRGSQGST